MFNIITNESLWGCFTPLASASLKDMSWFVRLCLRGGIVWTLFTCLWHTFLRDLNDPPVMGPPAIVFISPIMSWGAGADDRRSWKRIHADPCCPPWSYCTPHSSRIFVTFPSVSALLSALSGPGNPLCNGHDPCGNAVFILITNTGWRMKGSWPFKVVLVLNLH